MPPREKAQKFVVKKHKILLRKKHRKFLRKVHKLDGKKHKKLFKKPGREWNQNSTLKNGQKCPKIAQSGHLGEVIASSARTGVPHDDLPRTVASAGLGVVDRRGQKSQRLALTRLASDLHNAESWAGLVCRRVLTLTLTLTQTLSLTLTLTLTQL